MAGRAHDAEVFEPRAEFARRLAAVLRNILAPFFRHLRDAALHLLEERLHREAARCSPEQLQHEQEDREAARRERLAAVQRDEVVRAAAVAVRSQPRDAAAADAPHVVHIFVLEEMAHARPEDAVARFGPAAERQPREDAPQARTDCVERFDVVALPAHERPPPIVLLLYPFDPRRAFPAAHHFFARAETCGVFAGSGFRRKSV